MTLITPGIILIDFSVNPAPYIVTPIQIGTALVSGIALWGFVSACELVSTKVNAFIKNESLP